jgi:hypothetical protein
VEVLIPITFFVSIASVMILRPISKKLGMLIESAARERTQPPAEDATQARMALVLEHMMKRLDAMEDRLDFTERLVGNRPQLEARPDGRTDVRGEGRRTFSSRAIDPALLGREHLAG